MEYIVSARKYRPMSFDTVVGQSALTTTLKNAVKSGKLAHAYLFCGPRGVGKTTCARIFAKAINCQNGHYDIFQSRNAQDAEQYRFHFLHNNFVFSLAKIQKIKN